MTPPLLKKSSRISPIWILPVVALVIGGWLLYKGVKDAGIKIIVHFENAESVVPGKTQIMYKGIPVGTVVEITVDENMKGVDLYIEMDSRLKDSLVEDTLFWIVRPEISAGKISGVNTLFSGSYLETRPGISRLPAREFTGLAESPSLPITAPGLHIKFNTAALGSLQKGSQIYFNNIPIGSVQGYILMSQQNVLINAYIKPEYAHLVKKNTKFWNASGITFKGNLSGFKLEMESISSLIYGGIGMYTPKLKKNSPNAENGDFFTLYEDLDDSMTGIHMTLKLCSAEGLAADTSRVMYRGLKVGTVSSLTFNRDNKKRVTANIIINPESEFILREKTRFWVARPKFSINRIQNMETILKGAYITFEPGGGKFCDDFTAGVQPNSKSILRQGKKFTLVSENSRSFSIGAPVFYKELQVGEITAFDLAPGGNHILADFLIYARYTYLVRSDSIFWKTGGIHIDAGLDGVSVKAEMLTTLFTGGVAFITPGALPADSRRPNKKKIFHLYQTYQKAIDATPVLQSKGVKIQLQAISLKSVSSGTPILYKQVEVGEITGFQMTEKGENIILDAFIQKKYAHLLKTTSRFYNASGVDIKGNLSGVHIKTGSLKSIIAGGIGFFLPFPGEPVKKNHSFTLYNDYQAALDADKIKIFLNFASPHGIKEGVDIKYQGIALGKVKKVVYGKGMESVIATVLVDKESKMLFREDTRIWLVAPELTIFGVKNLDSIITGPYIALKPGKGDPVVTLTALAAPPFKEEIEVGLNIILQSRRLGSLKKKSPVYYRQIRIGSVTGYDLSPNASRVWVYINISPPYTPLIRKNTRFWNASGIKMTGGIFSGVKIDAETIASIVAGGIAMATPENYKKDKKGAPAADGDMFTLHEKGEKKWLLWNPEIQLKKRFQKNHQASF